MKHNIRKTVIAMFACVLAVTGIAGCSSSLDGNEIVAEVGDREVPLGVANFYVRYMYQLMYDSYYMEWYGEDLWEQEWEEGVVLEDSVKQDAMDDLKRMYILDALKEDYNVSLSEDDEAAITEAAQGFIEENSDEALEAMTATEEHIVEFLSIYTTSERVTAEIKSDVDTEVSDEEAAQKRMAYVTVEEVTDEEAEEAAEEVSDADLEADATEIAERVSNGEDFDEVVEELGYTSSTYTFDSESTYPTEEVIAAADELAEGEVTDVIEGTDVYYVAYLESEFDEDATETQKEVIITERENELFDEVYEGFEAETDFTLYESVWEQVDFLKQGVTYYTPDEDEEEDTDDDATEDTDDSTDEDTDDEDEDDAESGEDEEE